MNKKRTYKRYTEKFKEEVVSLVLERGYSVAEAAQAADVKPSLVYAWKYQMEDKFENREITSEEREELDRLRKENHELRLEKDILKKASAYFAREMK